MCEAVRIQGTFIDFNVKQSLDETGAESTLRRCDSAPDVSGPTTAAGTIGMMLSALTKHCGNAMLASKLAFHMMCVFRPVNASRREERFWQSVQDSLKAAVSQSPHDPDFSGRNYKGHTLPCLFKAYWPADVPRSPWEGVIDMLMWKFAAEIVDSAAPTPQFLLQGGIFGEYLAFLTDLKGMETNHRAKAKAKVRHVDTAGYYRRLLDHTLTQEQLKALVLVAFGGDGLVSGALKCHAR